MNLSDNNSQQDVNSAETSESGSDSLQGALNASSGFEPMIETRKPLNRSSLVLFGLLVIGGGLVYLMYLKSAPSAASAATPEAEEAHKTITQFLDGGGKNIVAMQEMLQNTEKVVQEFLTYPSAQQVPLSDLKTNPFRYSDATPKGDPNAGASDAEAKRLQEQARRQVLAAIGEMQLQSIIHSGKHKACMINNTLYQEGQQIEQFTIEQINPGSVVVRNGPYRFELKMQR
jgi:hypothetical protein